MMTTIVILQLLAAPLIVPGQIDSICGAHCEILAVQEGRVRFIDQRPPTRSVDLGKYIPTAQPLVPRTEAPVRDLRSQSGWRVVTSVYLDHGEDAILTHIRFFGPDGTLRGTDDVLSLVEQAKIGTLFDGSDQIFAVTSNEEHAYNVQTKMWFLPSTGGPKLLATIPGTFQQFADGAGGKVAGVTVKRQTYDGVHADTKGTVDQFYVWDRSTKTLKLQAQ